MKRLYLATGEETASAVLVDTILTPVARLRVLPAGRRQASSEGNRPTWQDDHAVRPTGRGIRVPGRNRGSDARDWSPRKSLPGAGDAPAARGREVPGPR